MVEGQNDKAGPSGPPTGLLEDIAASRIAKLTNEDAPALLAALRSGSNDARLTLQARLRYLIYADRRGSDLEPVAVLKPAFLDRLGTRMQAVLVAIDRLSRNEVTDVKKFVSDEIHRASHDQRQQDAGHILVPPSTKSTRKKRGQKPHQSLMRVHLDDEQDDEDGYRKPTPLEDPPIRIPVVTEPEAPMPEANMIAADLADAVAHDEFERDVLGLLRDGYAIRSIAATLSTTKARIEATIKRFRVRAEKYKQE